MIDSKERADRFKKARLVYNKHGKESVAKVCSAINAEEQSVSRTMIDDLECSQYRKKNGSAYERPVRYQSILQLADYYGVNVAWLMGQSDSPSLNEDSQVVTRVTGLSCEAVESIQFIREHFPDYIDILNCILKDRRIRNALELMSIAIQKLDGTEATGESWDAPGSVMMNAETMLMEMDGKETARYLMNRSADIMKEIIEKIIISVWDSKQKEEQ